MERLAAPDPPLSDGHVALRAWSAQDVGAVVAAARDPLIRRFSHLPEPFDARAVHARVERMPAELAAGTALRLLICEPAEEAHVLGAIALFDISRERAAGEIGYWVAAAERGRGVAARSVGLLTGWALDSLGLDAVRARCDLGNGASVGVLRRCGYALLGLAENGGREALVLERRRSGGPAGAPPAAPRR